MDFVCQHCEQNFASKYNLRRHMERKHDSWNGKQEQEIENSERDSDPASQNSSIDGESNESEDDSESEDSDVYTYDEVRAILRYALQQQKE